MKQLLTTTTILTALILTNSISIAGPRAAGKSGVKPRKGGVERVAERATAKEEEILSLIDDHAWKKDPEARDHRSENLREYSNHTYKRIVRLLTLGAIEEQDGTTFKNRHESIVKKAKDANADGLDAAEKIAIRNQLNALNDEINAAITKKETGSTRTPLVNLAQHRFEERIQYGIKSGRLSTLEASSLRRKVAKLEKLEERLKGGKELSANERKRLMTEVLELRRDITKALID